jgi:hypothetical protein
LTVFATALVTNRATGPFFCDHHGFPVLAGARTEKGEMPLPTPQVQRRAAVTCAGALGLGASPVWLAVATDEKNAMPTTIIHLSVRFMSEAIAPFVPWVSGTIIRD